MDPGLLTFIRKHHTKNSSDYTHYTSFGPNSKWAVSESNFESFWKGYCRLVYDSPEAQFCLAEMPKPHMPVIADFTLKFHPLDGVPDGHKSYGTDFLLNVIYCFQQAMSDTLQLGEERVELICCVMESEEYMEDNLIISRFRLHFPYCKTSPMVQKRNLRPAVLQWLRVENVISRLDQQPVNDWENIINPVTVENPVMLYGSIEHPNEKKLVLEYMFFEIERDNIDEEKAKSLEVDDILKLANHTHVQKRIVSASMFAGEEIDFWLPMLFSIDYWGVVTKPLEDVAQLNVTPKKRESLSSSTIVYDDETDVMVDRFLSMLSIERAEKNHFWMDVGRSLYGAFSGDERGLEAWIRFTEQSDQHTADDCRNKYHTFYETKLTIKTLAWYAKEDSPDAYLKWHKEWYAPALEQATSCLHSDVAEALYRVYWLEFACSSLAKSNLYHFKNHIWKRLDNGHTLRVYISGDFLSKFERFRTEISVMIQESPDRHFKDSAEVLVKKLGKLIDKLKMRTFKNNVLSESLEKFHIEEFSETLDTDPNLMGMVNGILEVCDKDAVLRDGKPEDFMSKTTGLIWRHDLHWKHPLVIQLMSWLSKVYPNKELLDYAGKLGGSCLKGRNSDKLFVIHTGNGNNSKSMIKKIYEAAFGAYCITFPTAVFTQKRSGGGPDPAVARSKYARIVFAQEPDADDPLKNGTIKEMTGGDRFFARFLQDNGGEIEPMFKLFLMCNTVPGIPHSDKAMKNRVRLLPYLSTWTLNPPKSIAEQLAKKQFKMDPFFENQIPEMAPAFMWYLAQMYGKYRREGLIEPSIVTQTTTEYWNENDFYLTFISENLEKVYVQDPKNPGAKGQVDKEAKITVAQMYTRFRDWFRENYQGIKCPDRPIVKGELEERMGKTYRKSWRGITWKITVADI